MDMYLNSNRTGSTQNTEVHAAINNKRSTLSVILQVSSVDFRRKQVKHTKHYNYSLYSIMYDESYTQCACYSYKQSTSKQRTVYQEYVYHYGMQTMYNAQKLDIYMYRTHMT